MKKRGRKCNVNNEAADYVAGSASGSGGAQQKHSSVLILKISAPEIYKDS
jgi:hypothetical protein